MALHEKICHLRYCRLISKSESVTVRFENTEYRLLLVDERFPSQKGLTILRSDGEFISPDFLLWLSIYIGEDLLDPFQEVDTRFVWHRGYFSIGEKDLQRFLHAAERALHRSWPAWKRDLFDSALVYFSGAIRAGVNYMPINLGLFALSLECLGNVRYGKRDKHFTFGDRHFMNLLTPRLAPIKRDPAKKLQVKAFEKRLKSDLDFLNHLRNAFYGHSLLHLAVDRRRLVDELRKWAIRSGCSKKFATLSFRYARVKDDIVRESFGLYKLGLRLNRLFIFLALGFSAKIPFATHDFQMFGDMRNDEESEFRGMRMRFSDSSGT